MSGKASYERKNTIFNEISVAENYEDNETTGNCRCRTRIKSKFFFIKELEGLWQYMENRCYKDIGIREKKNEKGKEKKLWMTLKI